MAFRFRSGHGKAARSARFEDLSASEARAFVDQLKVDPKTSDSDSKIVVETDSGSLVFTSQKPETKKAG